MDDEVTDSHDRFAALEQRVRRIEVVAFYSAAVTGFIALIVGMFVPFLRPGAKAEEVDEALSLASAVFELPAAGEGPFESEARAVGVVLGIYFVAVLVTVIASFVMQSTGTAKRFTFARICSIVLLVGSVGAWLLVAVLSGIFEGATSAFSPAVLTLTIGSILTLCAAQLGRYILEQSKITR